MMRLIQRAGIFIAVAIAGLAPAATGRAVPIARPAVRAAGSRGRAIEVPGTARHASRVLAGRFTRRAIVAGGALLAASLVAPRPGLAVAFPAALSGVHVFGWGFDSPADPGG